MSEFASGTSYPIATLPDDLHDATIPNDQRWALRDALFWNDCQGWWIEHIADVRGDMNRGQCIAKFWQPLPHDPMTRIEILKERGYAGICEDCDHAIARGEAHHCSPSAVAVVRAQRALKARHQATTRKIGEKRHA